MWLFLQRAYHKCLGWYALCRNYPETAFSTCPCANNPPFLVHFMHYISSDWLGAEYKGCVVLLVNSPPPATLIIQQSIVVTQYLQLLIWIRHMTPNHQQKIMSQAQIDALARARKRKGKGVRGRKTKSKLASHNCEEVKIKESEIHLVKLCRVHHLVQ